MLGSGRARTYAEAVKLTVLLLIAACTTNDTPQLPAAETTTAACPSGLYNGAGNLWTGRRLTDADQCELPCQSPGFAHQSPGWAQINPACEAHDPMYGAVHCDLTYQDGPVVMGEPFTGLFGCCVSGATAGPVNFAVCDNNP